MRDRVNMQMQMENLREQVVILVRRCQRRRLPVGMGHSIDPDKERFSREQMP